MQSYFTCFWTSVYFTQHTSVLTAYSLLPELFGGQWLLRYAAQFQLF